MFDSKYYGPWALITGASEGIGRALAIELARNGLNILAVARRRDLLESLSAEVNQLGTQCRFLTLDLGDPDEISQLEAEARKLDIGLVALAAGFGTSGAFLDNAIDSELNMVDVNCRAVARLTHSMGNQLRHRSVASGGIILFSSIVAFQGVPYAANYAATKAYVQTLGEALAIELKEHDIHVLVVAPGPVVTGFGKRAQMNITNGITPELVAQESLAALGKQTTVRPGFLSKILELGLTSTCSRWGRTRVMKKVMAGMIESR